MSYTPVLPSGGYLGWKFLQRTEDLQRKLAQNSPEIKREVDYFRNKIAQVSGAEDLTKDRRLLGVALTAFGLSDDINNKFFVKKILESDPLDRSSLANKLGDKRYGEIAKRFAFGSVLGPNTPKANFAEDIAERYLQKRIEAAVGAVDPNLRLALNTKQAIKDANKAASSNSGRWFSVLGNPPLRAVFEKALNLPASIGTLDIDIQEKQFRQQAKKIFGSDEFENFNSADQQERLIQNFMLKSQAATYNQKTSSAQTAMQLISYIPPAI